MYYLDIALNQASEPQHAEPPVPSAGTAASQIEQLATPVFDKSPCLLWGRSAGLAVVLAGPAVCLLLLSVWGHRGMEERPALCSRFSPSSDENYCSSPRCEQQANKKTSPEWQSPSLFHFVRTLLSKLPTVPESPLWGCFFVCVCVELTCHTNCKTSKNLFRTQKKNKTRKTIGSFSHRPSVSTAKHFFHKTLINKNEICNMKW